MSEIDIFESYQQQLLTLAKLVNAQDKRLDELEKVVNKQKNNKIPIRLKCYVKGCNNKVSEHSSYHCASHYNGMN